MILRIQTRGAFSRVRREGVRVRSGPLSCTMVVDSSLAGPHVGYALGRSFGSAVARNRLRRQLRVLVKEAQDGLRPGVYVFGASPRASAESFEALRSHLQRLVTQMGSHVARPPAGQR